MIIRLKILVIYTSLLLAFNTLGIFLSLDIYYRLFYSTMTILCTILLITFIRRIKETKELYQLECNLIADKLINTLTNNYPKNYTDLKFIRNLCNLILIGHILEAKDIIIINWSMILRYDDIESICKEFLIVIKRHN